MTNHSITSQVKMRKTLLHFNLALFLFLFASCNKKEQTPPPQPAPPSIHVTTEIIIGEEGQPPEHQLGQPVAVRTDRQGHIYIADRLSKQIKVFDEQGRYVRSIGGRGRGPGEFQDFEFMELTPEGHLAFLDRGNARFIVITTDGEEIATFAYSFEDQFYPQAVRYLDDVILSLFYRSSSQYEVPVHERDLFHIYTKDYQQRMHSFFPIKTMNFEDDFLLRTMAWHPGSFSYLRDTQTLFFSPSTYQGVIYIMKKTGEENSQWEFLGTAQGEMPGITPYQTYQSQEHFISERNKRAARIMQISWGTNLYFGRQLSMDAGMFELSADSIIHFYSVLDKGYEYLKDDSEAHKMNLYAQIFDADGKHIDHSFLTDYVELFKIPRYSLVNWKDHKNRFYMIEYIDEFPVVRRFKLDFKNDKSAMN